MPTIREVAEACGVSPMTVSFVLNNRPGQVSPATRDRVLSTVREMGYRPGAIRAHDRRSTNTLGIVAGMPTASLVQPGYFSRILQGVLIKADNVRQNVTLFTSSLLHADTHRSIRIYCDGRCDGLLVISPHRDSQLVASLQERGTPYVLVGSSPDNEDIPWCDVDNESELYKVAEYLIKLGHRRIAFCGGPGFVPAAIQRYSGYCKAMRDHGIPVDPSLVKVDIDVHHNEYLWMLEQLRRSPSRRPTALLAWNDTIASLGIRAALDAGLKVPEDVSVTGFDDDDPVILEYPFLTTVRQPYDRLGAGMVEIVLAQIKGNATMPRQRIERAEFIIRGSAAPPAR